MADVTITYAQEAQFRRWATDPVAFCCEAVKIESTVTEVIDGTEVTKRGRVVPLNLHDRPYQVDCIEKFLQNDLCTVLKARQIGLTTIACALALWLLLFHENRFILVLSKSDGDAKKFLRRIRRMYERLDPWVKARAPQPKKKFGVQEAEFTNGSSIYSYTSASDHGRGDTPTEVFLDEVGKMKNADDSWSDLRPATEDGGKLWIFGTADGYRDWFHLKWMEWEKDPEICDIFYGWEAVPGRDEAWAAKMRRELGEAKFLREYPATPEEAFQSSGSNVFSVEVLTEIVPDEPRRYRIERGPTGMLDLMEEATHTDEFGLFIYEIMVAPMGHFSGWAGAVALAVIVIPVVVRTTEDMLTLVPDTLREAAASIGLPRALMITRIAYRAARAGIVTGILLAVARISGETAPLLFTALNNQFFSANMNQPMPSLPVVIFQFALSPYAEWQKLAWTGALLITVTVLGLSILARSLTSARKS